MMAQYEADKIIHLLKFCSWKAQTELAHKGLHELRDIVVELIDPSMDKGETPPNEKYYVDLLSNARTALKRDNVLIKREFYINLLLRYAGFNSMRLWTETFYKTAEYSLAQLSNSTVNTDIQFAVWIPELLQKNVLRSLEFARSTAFPKPNFVSCKTEDVTEALQHLQAELTEHSIVVAVLPLSWKHIPVDYETEWNVLLKSEKIIPVWVGPKELWDTIPPVVPGLKQSKVLGGIPGILATMLFLESKTIGDSGEGLTESGSRSAGPDNIQHFHNPTGGIFIQGKIDTVNHNSGGSQTINNYIK